MIKGLGLDLRDLQWAMVAAQHRSLRQAADSLYIRQSTLSRGLRQLEYRLDAAIFERSNGGTRPTVAGQEFLDSARQIIEQMAGITDRLKARSQGQVGRLTVGVHTSLSAGNLRATLIEHRKRFPDVEVSLVDGSSDHLIFGLAQSIIDIAFVLDGSVRWDGRSLRVWAERIVAALPEHHPLASAETLRWTDLRSEYLLLPHRGPGLELKSVVLKKLGQADQFRFLCHDVSLDRLLTLVGAGWGIQLALEGATGAAYPGVIFREVCDHDGPTRLGFSACWRQASYNPCLEPFLDLLRERYPALAGGCAPG